MLPRVSRLSLALLLLPLLSLAPAAAEEPPAEAEPLLQVEGALEDSDPVLPEDNTRYDEYPFEGQAGQTITIVLESLEFDTYVLLKNSAGQIVGQNDDYEDGNRNSAITFTLLESGTYTIVAKAYSESSRGEYRLTVLAGSEPVFLSAEEQIQKLEQRLAEYRAVGDRENEAETLYRLGQTYDNLEQYSQALESYNHALKIYESLNDKANSGSTLSSIAYLKLKRYQYSQARTVFQQQLDIARQIADPVQEVQALLGIGSSFVSQAQASMRMRSDQQTIDAAEQAINPYEQALALSKANDFTIFVDLSVSGLVNAYSAQASSLSNQRQHSEAIAIYQQVISILQANSQWLNQQEMLQSKMLAWSSIAIAYHDDGRYADSIVPLQAGFQIAEQLNDSYWQANFLLIMANSYKQLSDYTRALEVSQQALSIIQRELDDSRQEIVILSTIGQVYSDMSQYSTALEYYEQGLSIARKIEDADIESGMLGNIATLFSYQGRYKQALEYQERVLSLAQNRVQQLQTADEATLQQICEDYDSLAEFAKQNCLEVANNFLAKTLNNIAITYHSMGRYKDAIIAYQQSLEISNQNNENGVEQGALNNLGLVYLSIGDLSKAQELFQQAFNLAKDSGNKAGQATLLNNLGRVYSDWGQYFKALELFYQGLAIAKDIKALSTEASILGNMAGVYETQGQYLKSAELQQTSLAIRQQIGDQEGEAISYNNIAHLLLKQGEFYQALEYLQKALKIAQTTGNRAIESSVLGNMASVYSAQGDYYKQIQLEQQSLLIEREIGSRSAEAISLNNLGIAESITGDRTQGLVFLKESLQISRETGSREEQSNTLTVIGVHYAEQGEFTIAADYYAQALGIAREDGTLSIESNVLLNMGTSSFSQAEYAKALEYYQQSLNIVQKLGERPNEIDSLRNLGQLYTEIGQYLKALEIYQQGLAIAQEIGAKPQEGQILSRIGEVYEKQGQYDRALQYYQQALQIHQTTGNRGEESRTLRQLGGLYNRQNQSTEAVAALQKSLQIAQETGATLLFIQSQNELGKAYLNQGNVEQALPLLQQALLKSREIGDRASEALALSMLGELWAKQNQSETAVAFYKQSVNVTEAIRRELRGLDQEQQQAYTETVSDRYRQLADLLITQGRLSEAQQVLELLKLEELREFTRSAATPGQAGGVVVLEVEQAILDDFGSFSAFAQQLADCEQTQCPDLQEFRNQLTARTIEFNEDINGFRKTLQERLAKDSAFLTSDDLAPTARDIVTAEPGTVLVYPLILPDKIRILLALRAGNQGVIFRSFEVDVNQQTLWQTVARFRQQLGEATPTGPVHSLNDVQATAAQLYTWLIQPLEAELQAQGQEARHLVFALDRSTRYIPMAALYNSDTRQYLMQRYAVSTILSASLTDTDDRLSANPGENTVLGLGLSMPVGNFSALDYVPAELDGILKTDARDPQGIYPGTELLNQAFTFENLQNQLTGHRILHIASHAAFEAPPENSFILSGRGEIRLNQLQALVNSGIDNVHLVVLSACQTGMGGPDSSGIEMPGISYYFLTNGAKSVMASLWNVNDRSTSLLMQQFYQNLSEGMTKAAALQQAQNSLLTGATADSTSTIRADIIPTPDGGVGIRAVDGAAQPVGYAHPYYWAPFILIGNGL